MTNAIQTHGLTKRFRRVNALSGLDLSVTEGAMHALVGPNGAGKTTLIKILMNILRASGGQATVLGIDSTKISGKAFASIGYVSENQQLPEWMSVGYFLTYVSAFYPTWDSGLQDHLAKQFDLPLDRKLKHLSRGMRMKVALASALAFRPKLIVLDEPFSGLDPLVRDELAKALLERANDATIFLSSHDLAEIEGFATHVTFLDAGKVRLSEEMASLIARFREVEIAMDPQASVPLNLPSTWLIAEMSNSTLRFVDSSFNEETTREEIAKRFGTQPPVKCSSMTLRAIFLALAKSGKVPASQEGG